MIRGSENGKAAPLLWLLVMLVACAGSSSAKLFEKARALEEGEHGYEACQIYDTLVQRGYRVDEIRSKRLYQRYREIEDRYSQEVAAGDKAFAASRFVEAREAYYRASALHPDDAYPQEQIKRIEEILARQEQ